MKHFIFILGLIVAFAHVGQSEPQCVNPYTRIGTKSYYIERTQKLNWFAAAARCMQLGGQLLTIENERELAQLRSTLTNQGYTAERDDWLWTSGFGKPGAFLAYGDPIRLLPFENWQKNQPDDTNSHEDCINIILESGGLVMNDLTCRRELQFICETLPSLNVSNSLVRSGFLDKL